MVEVANGLRSVLVLMIALLGGCLHPVMQPAAPPASTSVPSDTVPFPACPDIYNVCVEASLGADAAGHVAVGNGFGRMLEVSANNGATWKTVRVPALSLDGMPTYTDTDSLVTMTSTGRLLFSSIAASYGDAPMYVAGGITLLGLHVAVSDDLGKTWLANSLVTVNDAHMTLGADRQWLTPAPDGSLYLSYNHFLKSAILPYDPVGAYDLVPPSLDTLEVARSTDAGRTWSAFKVLNPAGFATGGQPAVTQGGELLIPAVAGPDDFSSTSAVLFRSTDHGASWKTEVLEPVNPNGPSWFATVAADPDGTLAYAWFTANGTIRAATQRPGTPWSTPIDITQSDEHAATGPALLALGGDRFAISLATERQLPNGLRYGPLLVATFSPGSEANRTFFSTNETWALRGANGDFTTLARTADGRLCAAVARFERGFTSIHFLSLAENQTRSV